MTGSTVDPAVSGLEVIDLQDYPPFLARPAHPRNPAAQVSFIERLATALLQNPDSILQWLVDSALDMCGADSAGISMERYFDPDSDTRYDIGPVGFQWVATAGRYRSLIDAVVPSSPSASNICLDRGRPQLYRASGPFLLSRGLDTTTITDGLIVPWEAEERRGTMWILAHGRTEAFDQRHLETLELLARFVALCITQQQSHNQKRQEWAVVAASAVIKVLAHRIHEPLRDLSHLIFLAQAGRWDGNAATLAEQLSRPLSELTDLIDGSLGQSANAHYRPN
jgi:hypothetical protein